MKFSQDLAREILLNIEEHVDHDSFPSIKDEAVQMLAPETDLTSLFYHIDKLQEAGFINAFNTRGYDGSYGSRWIPTSLTYAGHQFLDDIRDRSRWEKIKAVAGPMGFTTMKALMPEIAKKVIGL